MMKLQVLCYASSTLFSRIRIRITHSTVITRIRIQPMACTQRDFTQKKVIDIGAWRIILTYLLECNFYWFYSQGF